MLLTDFLRARRITHYSRKQVLTLRDKRLRETLHAAYDQSKFYRDLWTSAGIQRSDLATIDIAKLPLVTKKQLMESFDHVVTEQGITRAEVESFIAKEAVGSTLFKNKYIALNTSGSSGYIGLFLFTTKFWHRLIGTVMARLLPLPLSYFVTGRVRIAFVGETSGHHAGVSLIGSAPSFVLKTLSVSTAMPQEALRRALHEFKPNVLVGYASSLTFLADDALKGTLTIRPKIIVSSGEPLDSTRSERLMSAFGTRPFDFYGATECVGMGASLSEAGKLDLFDDILLVENVDDQGMVVPRGQVGRVVITIFGNTIEPLIRYIVDDEMILEEESDVHPFTRTSKIMGRTLERLHFDLPAGPLEIHPMDLVGFFLPGLIHYQVVQTSPTSVTLRVVAEGNKDELGKKIQEGLQELLQEMEVPKDTINFSIAFVDHIEKDPHTGKTPLIIPLARTPGAVSPHQQN